MNYQNIYPNNNPYYRAFGVQGGERQFFFPFLTGALVGGAAVGLTRPRPIYNVAPNGGGPGYGPGPRPPYNPGYPYYYNSYGGYIPR